MNERIRKLAIETDAWCDQRYLGDQCYDIKWEQKFAELIVRECAEIAKKVDGDESDDYQSGRTWAGIDVLEHFGVKE